MVGGEAVVSWHGDASERINNSMSEPGVFVVSVPRKQVTKVIEISLGRSRMLHDGNLVLPERPVIVARETSNF